ncbi:MAG: hypothetical protein NTY98_01605 [Verrucomicrobia bacterium]|nr:hypothetical protein [Verrucomicrobiota bacterium]
MNGPPNNNEAAGDCAPDGHNVENPSPENDVSTQQEEVSASDPPPQAAVVADVQPKCSETQANFEKPEKHEEHGCMNSPKPNNHGAAGVNLRQWHKFLLYVRRLNWAKGVTKHEQQYHAFLRAASLGLDFNMVVAEISRRVEAVGGQLLPHALERQAERAYDHVANEATKSPKSQAIQKLKGGMVPKPQRTTKMPRAEFSLKTLKKTTEGMLFENVREFVESKSVLPPATTTSQQFLNALYHAGENIIVFTKFESQGQFVYSINSDAGLPEGGPDGVWFLSNPVDGRKHPNPRQGGKLSRRSEESVTSWRYLVLESDEAPFDDWLRFLVLVPLPIAAIYTSGGKSIHALVRMDAASKQEWDVTKKKIERTLVVHGADPAALTAVRLTRLPQCWRGAKRQELLYINPEPGRGSIWDLTSTSDNVPTSREGV